MRSAAFCFIPLTLERTEHIQECMALCWIVLYLDINNRRERHIESLDDFAWWKLLTGFSSDNRYLKIFQLR